MRMAARIDLEIQAPGHYTSAVLIYPSPVRAEHWSRWITLAGFKEIFWILNTFPKLLAVGWQRRPRARNTGLNSSPGVEIRILFFEPGHAKPGHAKPSQAICAEHAPVELRPAFG